MSTCVQSVTVCDSFSSHKQTLGGRLMENLSTTRERAVVLTPTTSLTSSVLAFPGR